MEEHLESAREIFSRSQIEILVKDRIAFMCDGNWEEVMTAEYDGCL